MASQPPLDECREETTGTDGEPSPSDVAHRGTPLVGILLLIAVAAVAAGIIRSGISRVTFDDRYRPPRRRGFLAATAVKPPGGLHWVDRGAVIATAITVAVPVTLLGVAVGLWRRPRIQRGLAGGVAGLVIGAATGLLICCPPSFGAIFAGAAVILAAAFAYQLCQQSSERY